MRNNLFFFYIIIILINIHVYEMEIKSFDAIIIVLLLVLIFLSCRSIKSHFENDPNTRNVNSAISPFTKAQRADPRVVQLVARNAGQRDYRAGAYRRMVDRITQLIVQRDAQRDAQREDDQYGNSESETVNSAIMLESIRAAEQNRRLAAERAAILAETGQL
jgi:hypothetical protein